MSAKKKAKKKKPGKAALSRRFKEAARDIGADQSGSEFERAFERLVPPAKIGDKRAEAKSPKVK